MFRFNRPTAALLVAALLAACGGEEAPAPETLVRPAKLVTVASASSRRDLSFPAVVQAIQSAELTFQIPGEVVELNVLEGTDVTAGTVIARLDQRDARNSLAQAQAEFQNAQSEYNRAERLVAQDAISRSALESRKTQLDVTAAAVDTARKALDDTVIRAPFDGGVSRVYVEQYQNVQAKEAVAIIQSAANEAIIDVPATIIARAEQLEFVNTRIALDVSQDTEIPALFREASGVADESSQTYKIRFSFDSPENLVILPGMTATLFTTVVFKGAEDIVSRGTAVPLAAILAEGDRRFVWVVGDNMQLAKREVVVAADFDQTATVTSGLSDGETIVAAGVAFLAEGMTVREWIPE